MKLRRSFAPVALALASAALVAGCGGGDPESGSLTAFNVVPSSITLRGPDADTCAGGYAGRVHVYGGAGPYRVDNTDPSLVALSKTTVGGPGDYFDVFYTTATCMDPVLVVVVDQWGRQVTLTLRSVKGTT